MVLIHAEHQVTDVGCPAPPPLEAVTPPGQQSPYVTVPGIGASRSEGEEIVHNTATSGDEGNYSGSSGSGLTSASSNPRSKHLLDEGLLLGRSGRFNR